MGLLEDNRFLTATTSAILTYFTIPTNFSTAVALAAFVGGWQLGGCLTNKKIGNKIVYGCYYNNGSYPNPINISPESIRWTAYDKVRNFFSNKKSSFYVDNFRFNLQIKNRLNFINKRLAKKAEKKDLYMKWEDLAKGSLIVGSMGSGKTEFLNSIITQWINTNRRIIFHDTKGEFVKWFYNENNDYIINYLDKRGVYWDFFEDIENGLETEIVYNFFSAFFTAKTGESSDKFWQSKAATRFKEIFEEILLDEEEKNKLEALAIKLKKYLTTEHESKIEQSVAATLEEAVEIFFYFAFMKKNGNKKFLVTKFFNHDKNSKIFLHTISNVIEQNIPFLTAFLNVLFKYQLTYFNKAKEENFILYVLDEYLTFFEKMSKELRKNVHTKARSYGILLLPAIQFLPENKEIKEDLLGSIKNLFVFSISDPTTIKIAKEIIGKSKIKTRKKIDKQVDFEEKEEIILDDNLFKKKKPGHHITYIRDEGVLYEGYTRRTKIVDKNEEYIYNNKSKEFIAYKRKLETLANNENEEEFIEKNF